MVAVLQLKNVHKRYESAEVVHALHGISLTVESGEFVAIMGASGSGKSTMMNVLGCLDTPTSGEYWLDGVPVAHLTRDELAGIRQNKIGFIFQGFNLIPRATALENVELPMLHTGRSVKEIQQQAHARLAQVGLSGRVDHFPSQLSGGQQQRVAIARSLINRPRVLLADEPTGNLDTKTSAEVMGVLQALNDTGVTIVLVTHEPDIAAHCKRRVILRDGEIVEDTPVENRLVPSHLKPFAKSQAPIAETAGASSGLLLYTLAILKVAIRNLRRTMLRTSLSALGVVIGVAAVIALVGIGNGARAEVERAFSSISPNLLLVSAYMPRELWRGDRPTKVPYGDGLQLEDHEAIRKGIKRVARSSVVIAAGKPEVSADGRSSEAAIVGIDAEGIEMLHRRFVDGAPFGSTDVSSAASVALISEFIAQNLFGSRNPIGEVFSVNDVPFVVIGVMENYVPITINAGADPNDKTVIVPYTSLLGRIDQAAPISIQLQAEKAEDLAGIQREVEALLKKRWGSRLAVFDLGNVEQRIRDVTKGKETMTLLLGAMGSIALLVGAIGIANIMLVSVTERTREIGIRLAIGTRSRDILLQFLLEAVIITVLGGLIGIIVGIGAAFSITYFNDLPTLITLNTVLGVVLLSALVGILSGVLPARRAANLDPIQALRSE